jgi:hypothetical protein
MSRSKVFSVVLFEATILFIAANCGGGQKGFWPSYSVNPPSSTLLALSLLPRMPPPHS